eukprot:gnl/TRDRNA2_/TRDRNA2_58227_c0_seq1.p1 gnl/TRDRNA2_/TRDRNA2_58227_c0~~gnl/TRDRNA2_/TRDRNA2_58227_c0_seq1.p1  ORF type:complete len:809 (-),score=69.38 gnl/TRDRNA2_/TRDRNA2_58227_c0_seq1:100-2250(-)
MSSPLVPVAVAHAFAAPTLSEAPVEVFLDVNSPGGIPPAESSPKKAARQEQRARRKTKKRRGSQEDCEYVKTGKLAEFLEDKENQSNLPPATVGYSADDLRSARRTQSSSMGVSPCPTPATKVAAAAPVETASFQPPTPRSTGCPTVYAGPSTARSFSPPPPASIRPSTPRQATGVGRLSSCARSPSPPPPAYLRPSTPRQDSRFPFPTTPRAGGGMPTVQVLTAGQRSPEKAPFVAPSLDATQPATPRRGIATPRATSLSRSSTPRSLSYVASVASGASVTQAVGSNVNGTSSVNFPVRVGSFTPGQASPAVSFQWKMLDTTQRPRSLSRPRSSTGGSQAPIVMPPSQSVPKHVEDSRPTTPVPSGSCSPIAIPRILSADGLCATGYCSASRPVIAPRTSAPLPPPPTTCTPRAPQPSTRCRSSVSNSCQSTPAPATVAAPAPILSRLPSARVAVAVTAVATTAAPISNPVVGPSTTSPTAGSESKKSLGLKTLSDSSLALSKAPKTPTTPTAFIGRSLAAAAAAYDARQQASSMPTSPRCPVTTSAARSAGPGNESVGTSPPPPVVLQTIWALRKQEPMGGVEPTRRCPSPFAVTPEGFAWSGDTAAEDQAEDQLATWRQKVSSGDVVDGDSGSGSRRSSLGPIPAPVTMLSSGEVAAEVSEAQHLWTPFLTTFPERNKHIDPAALASQAKSRSQNKATNKSRMMARAGAMGGA